MKDYLHDSSVVIARSLARSGFSWEEIVEKAPDLASIRSRKARFNLLVGKTYKNVPGRVKAEIAKECLRKIPERSVRKENVHNLKVMDIINIRLGAAAGMSMKDIQSRYAPGVPLKTLREVIWGQLFGDYPGPIRKKRGSGLEGLSKREQKRAKNILDRLDKGDVTLANFSSLSSEEAELIEYLRKHAKTLKQGKS